MMENYEDIFVTKAQHQVDAPKNQLFDTEDFSARKTQEREALYALVDQTISGITADSSAFQSYLDVQCHFDRYSVANTALILAQMPQATRLMSFEEWKAAGARIQQGAKAITILAPGKEYKRDDGSTGVYYNPKKVFDISHTDQEPAPPKTHSHRTLLHALIERSPCYFAVSDDLTRSAMYDAESNTIYVRPGQDGNTYFRSVSHELAYMLMERKGNEYTEPEFTAYCVSYMVCKRAGIAADTFRFDQLPPSFHDMPQKELRKVLNNMRTIAGDLIVDMNRTIHAQEKAPKQRNNDAR